MASTIRPGVHATPQAALALDRKKLASVGNAGGNARPSLTNASERHSPLRFIAAERLRGRVKRRARGGPWGAGVFLSPFYIFYHSMIPLRPPPRPGIRPPPTTNCAVSSFGRSDPRGARRLSSAPHPPRWHDRRDRCAGARPCPCRFDACAAQANAARE